MRLQAKHGTLTHAFVSAVPDGADLGQIQPLMDWNDEHVFAGGNTGALLYYDATKTDHANWVASVAAGVLMAAGVGVVPAYTMTPSVTSITLATPLAVGSGGTGFATYAVGDLLAASAAAVLAKIPAVAAGQVLVSAGVTTLPAYSATPTATSFTSSRTALVTTPTDGLVLVNTTAALVGTPVQISPRLRWSGFGWDTDDAVSRTVTFFAEVLPVSAATVTGTLRFGFIDPVASTITYPIQMYSTGALTTTGVITSIGAAAQLVLNNSAADAGVTGQAYFILQTASTSRWYVGMSAGANTGNFDIYNGITAGLSLTIDKTSHLVTTLAGLKVGTGFGCNGTAAQTAVVSGGALAAYVAGANGLDTGAHMASLHALVVAIRTALVANGIMS